MAKLRFTKEKPIFCFGIDDNYVWPLLVSLYSAKKNFNKFKRVHIVYDPNKLHEKAISEVKNSCKILGIRPKFVSLAVPKNALDQGHITSTSYLRLQLSEIFHGKVFWFDTDLLFLKNWQEISSYALQRNMGRPAIFARLHWGNPESASNQAIIESKDQYFNSGVLLIDSKVWKENLIATELSSIIPNYSNLGFEWADQCLLNYYFRGDYGRIDLEYNSIPAEYIESRTRIIHFAGTHKPWTRYMSSIGEYSKIEGCFEDSDLQPKDKEAWHVYRTIEKELLELLTK